MERPNFRRQEFPFAIQVELTRGCNLNCTFCGINGFQEKPSQHFDHMTMETATLVAKRIADSSWNSRIEFARRGEPSMNPDFLHIIGVFRYYLPGHSLMMTSNGIGFLRAPGAEHNVLDAFHKGLDILALDDYKTAKIVPKIREKIALSNSFQHTADMIGLETFEYPAQPGGNPHRRQHGKRKVLSLVQDITEATKGTHATLNNHAGFGGPLNMDFKKPCAKPFREVGINWDGSIDLCCISWIGEMRLGNLTNSSLEELWQGDIINAARQKLVKGERDFRPCLGCDHPSYRTGLLPDKKGKETLPDPDEWTAEVIRAALAKGPADKPAARAMQNVYPYLPDAEKEVWDARRKD